MQLGRACRRRLNATKIGSMAVLRAYPVDVSRGTRAMITVPVAGGALESVCGLLRLFIKAHQHCQGEGGQHEQEGGSPGV